MTGDSDTTFTIKPRRPSSTIAVTLGVAACYFLGGKLGLSLAFSNASASPVWPPTGIALAALLIWGYRLWPAIIIGAFLVNITTQGSIITSLAIATGNTLEALLAAWLAQRFAGGPRAFDKPRNTLKFVLLAALLSTTVSATFGVITLCLSHLAVWNQYSSLWVTWWLGDTVSAVTIAPLILIWASQPLPRFAPRKASEGILLLLCIFLVCSVVFPAFLPFPDRNIPIGYLAILPLLWAAFRFGPHGAVTAAVLTSALAVVGTLNRVGPFFKPDPNQSLLFLQVFVGIITLTALLLAAVVSNLRHAEVVRSRLFTELNTLLEILPTGVWIGNRDCSEITGNPAAYQIMGFSPGINASVTNPEPQVPAGLRIFVNGAEVSPDQAPMQQVARTGKPWCNFEHELLFPDGTRKTVYASVAPLFDNNGQVRKVIGAYADFTDRKRAELELAKAKDELEHRVAERTEELRRTNAELEAFAFSLSHDLRSPLRTIRGYTEFALDDCRETLGPNAANLERVIAAADRMDRLIQAVLAFSRASRQELNVHAVDFETLLRAIIHERPDFQPPNAEIIIETPLPPVLGDEISLTQCVTNLLDNAIKFVPDGATPKITIRSAPTNSNIRLWFEDNGIGIEKSAQQTIFEMFQRGHSNSQYEGSGLGLAIVRKAVERMGGKVGVESEPGHGSRFWLELPKA